MNWSRICPWLNRHGNKVPTRRVPSKVQLAVESLEDRLVPSTIPTPYALWRQQVYHVDDATLNTKAVAAQTSVPSNASFGSLIGLPSAFANTPYRGDGYSVAVIDTGIDYNNPNLGGGFGPGSRVIAG